MYVGEKQYSKNIATAWTKQPQFNSTEKQGKYHVSSQRNSNLI